MVVVDSFTNALPAGYSLHAFEYHDEFTAVDIDREGNVVLQTVNRDRLASGWVQMLLQRKVERPGTATRTAIHGTRPAAIPREVGFDTVPCCGSRRVPEE